jgi:hypothetical protein
LFCTSYTFPVGCKALIAKPGGCSAAFYECTFERGRPFLIEYRAGLDLSTIFAAGAAAELARSSGGPANSEEAELKDEENPAKTT